MKNTVLMEIERLENQLQAKFQEITIITAEDRRRGILLKTKAK